MLYHVIRRPLNSPNTSNQPRNNQRSGSVPPTPKLMPRYHYSRSVQNNNNHNHNHNSDSTLTRNNLDETSSKSSMTGITTTTSNNISSTYGPFKSSFIPLVTNQRNRREFTQIPITREDGTTNNYTRTVPITYIETATLPATNNGNINSKQNFTSLLRPSAKYFQNNNNNTEESTTSNIPRLPSVSRRLSLTIPVMTAVNTDDETTKQTNPSSPTRQIPIRLPSTATVASIPTNSSRISSAILRSSPISNILQRQKTDIGDASSSSPTLITINNPQQTSSSTDFNMTSPIRRAEVTAREAIQGIARQQRTSISSENTNRSPNTSRRVIINLKNNQSVSLDSRLSSAMKPPPIPSSNRITQRNNLFHIPILQEIQMHSHPTATIVAEPSSSFPTSNNGKYKNEFHIEIPVTITSNNDQENHIEQDNRKEEEIVYNRERVPSANQTLKSILKRSSSRETVSRKNVSFMNA